LSFGQIIHLDYSCGRSSETLFKAFSESQLLKDISGDLEQRYSADCGQLTFFKEAPFCKKQVKAFLKCSNNMGVINVELIALLNKETSKFSLKSIKLGF
jgi:hypothetical protein